MITTNETAEAIPQDQARVLRTRDCRSRLTQLTAFENEHFGGDFAWSPEQNSYYLEAGSAFFSAIVRGPTESVITASMSVFLVTIDSCQLLLDGEIKETALLPWRQRQQRQPPVIYFASVICGNAAELPFLYGSIAKDALAHFQSHGITASLGLAISAGSAGGEHLVRNGFVCMGAKYLGHYDLMTISAHSAKTVFWQSLLTPTSEKTFKPFDDVQTAAFP